MNPYAYSPLLAALLNGFLIFWVFTQAANNPVRYGFLLWNVCLAFWNLGVAVGLSITDAAVASTWYVLVGSFAVRFIAPTFLHFVAAFTGEYENPKVRRLVGWSYASGLFFTVIGLTTHLIMKEATRYYWGYYPLAGRYEWTFGVSLYFISGYAFWLLIKARRQSSGYRRNQLNYILAGAAIVFGAGFTNFLPLYGISIYPVGNLMNSLYSVLVAYAIIEYGLMDIRLALRRGAVYGLLSGALTLVYLSIVSVFQRLFGHYGLSESYVYYTAAVPVTVVLAPTVKARIEPFVDSVPFWKTYHYTEILKDFGSNVLTMLDLPAVAHKVIEKMGALVNTQTGAVYVRHVGTPTFFCAAAEGSAGPDSLEEDHPVLHYIFSEKSELSKEKVLWQFRQKKVGTVQALVPSWLEAWPYALTLPLFIKQRFLGIIALGEKASRDMFNEDDIHLLLMLADQAAVALSNALRVTEIEALQKSLKARHDNALMGILATEIAHEVTKPLSRIMNERSRLGRVVEGKSQESLVKIEMETKRAADIIEGFALLSPHVPLPLVTTSLMDLIEEAIHNLGLAEDSKIKVVRSYEERVPLVLVNTGQISQVFLNVIQNAWQAMLERGVLTLSVKLLRILMEGSPVVEVRITDTGPGIPRELQEQVFDPFFTTKHALGGRGVGLTISRAMLERHTGTIRIQSPVTNDRGTCVIIQLPIRPKEDVL